MEEQTTPEPPRYVCRQFRANVTQVDEHMQEWLNARARAGYRIVQLVPTGASGRRLHCVMERMSAEMPATTENAQ